MVSQDLSIDVLKKLIPRKVEYVANVSINVRPIRIDENCIFVPLKRKVEFSFKHVHLLPILFIIK